MKEHSRAGMQTERTIVHGAAWTHGPARGGDSSPGGLRANPVAVGTPSGQRDARGRPFEVGGKRRTDMYPYPAENHDDELERRILSCLQKRGVNGLVNIEVSVTGGVATISGRLPSLHAKNICLECCRHVAGVLRTVDAIHVAPTLRRPSVRSLKNSQPTLF